MLDPKKDTPYLALMGKLRGIVFEYLWENRLRYNINFMIVQTDCIIYILKTWDHIGYTLLNISKFIQVGIT